MKMAGRSRLLWLGRGSGCAEVRKQASAYLEAEIPQAKRERIRRHLEGCEGCRRFFETLAATITMLKELPSRAIPQTLKSRLLRIPSQRKPKQG